MRQLMISLDKKILDSASAVAKRMIEYGKENELYILIPAAQKNSLDIGSRVHVTTAGGANKIAQLINLYKEAKKICGQNVVDSITTQDPFFTGLVGVCLKKKFKLPLEVQVHGDFFSGYYKRNPGFLFKLFLAVHILKKADTVRAVSERVKQSLIDGALVFEDKIVVRPITLNKLTEEPQEKNSAEDSDYFVWAGRMEAVKNITFLIDVFAEVVKSKPKTNLLLIGEGSEESFLKEKVSKLNLQTNIKFVSWVSSPYAYLKSAQALLFPSLSESYGAVAMEAYAAGTPVIMSDVGVANYELKPGPKVTILPSNDKNAWIEAILKI